MSLDQPTLTPSTAYYAGQQTSNSQRVITWIVIGVMHAAFFAMLLHLKATPQRVPDQTVTVSLVHEQQVSPEQPAAQPAPPDHPPPVQEVMTARPPTPSPIVIAVAEQPTAAEVKPADPPPPASAAAVASPPEAAIVPPDYTAAYLNNPGPKYPVASRRRHEEGVVALKVLVSAAGTPEQVLVEQSSGFVSLDEAAVEVVKKSWRFAPATQGNHPVSAWVAVAISFTLKTR